ncbi:MAG: hypothetical protein QM803_15670 [Rhodocyclaceae bacterium]
MAAAESVDRHCIGHLVHALLTGQNGHAERGVLNEIEVLLNVDLVLQLGQQGALDFSAVMRHHHARSIRFGDIAQTVLTGRSDEVLEVARRVTGLQVFMQQVMRRAFADHLGMPRQGGRQHRPRLGPFF